jgi:glyoxylase-like metal-dependent hydrolase (beta-lactamase superfamily II)
MAHYICMTCGVQFPLSPSPPASCVISEDEREFVGVNGQEWTTREELAGDHENQIVLQEPGLYSIRSKPQFAIGQRAFLVQTSHGNILWDCISLLDQMTIDRINQLGGIAAIAISHPHFFATMVDWSHAFGNAPIYLHKSVKEWVMRPDACIQFWEGDTKDLFDGQLKLVLTGGHFEGSQVLYWPEGASHKGILLSGDEPHICMDPKQVTFMHSYPNCIPLNAKKVRQIMERLQPLDYDRLYCGVISGGGGNGVIVEKAKQCVERSGKRYLKAIADD